MPVKSSGKHQKRVIRLIDFTNDLMVFMISMFFLHQLSPCLQFGLGEVRGGLETRGSVTAGQDRCGPRALIFASYSPHFVILTHCECW